MPRPGSLCPIHGVPRRIVRRGRRRFVECPACANPAPRAADEARALWSDAQAILRGEETAARARGRNLPAKRGSGLSPDVCEMFPQIRRGFLDGYFGNKIPPDYAGWDKQRQVLYEQMRQAGVMAKVNRVTFHSWPPDVALPAELVEADRKDLLDAD